MIVFFGQSIPYIQRRSIYLYNQNVSYIVNTII